MPSLLPLDPDQLLSTTRSVRKRLDLERPVDLAVIRECIDVACQAPTGGNNQGWHWLVVTDPEKKRPIAGWYRDAFKAVYGATPSLAKARKALANVAKPVNLELWYTPSHYGDSSADEDFEVRLKEAGADVEIA